MRSTLQPPPGALLMSRSSTNCRANHKPLGPDMVRLVTPSRMVEWVTLAAVITDAELRDWLRRLHDEVRVTSTWASSSECNGSGHPT